MEDAFKGGGRGGGRGSPGENVQGEGWKEVYGGESEKISMPRDKCFVTEL